MCGIAGILRVHPPGQAPPLHAAIPESWLDILDDAVRHRGPDGHGRFRDRALRPDGMVLDVAFVHRRLSILDHEGGHQPMVLRASLPPEGSDRGADAPIGPANSDPYRRTAEHALTPCPRCAALGRGTIAVVFNGCVYSHRELRRELQAAGHVFSTDHSDTEVLVHGWGEWAHDLFFRPALDGMWGVVIWDSASGVFAARDRFGQKPLSVLADADAPLWAFASSAGALARLVRAAGLPLAIRRSALGVWLRYGQDDRETPFDTIVQLPPAGMMHVPVSAPGGRRPRVTGGPRRPPASDVNVFARARGPALVDGVERLLDRAVAGHLDADVPLGCFLSGGVDSSVIALLAGRHVEPLTTLCVRMPDPRYDESAHAARVAAIIGSRHVQVDAAPDPAGDLPRLITTLGLPFGDSSLLPTSWVARAARGSLRVVLSGDGGDELFLGYERYQAVRWLRAARWAAMVTPGACLPRRDPRSRSARLARLLDAGRHHGYADLCAVFPTPDWFALLAGGEGTGMETPGIEPEDPLGARDADLETHFPGDMLRKVDHATLSAGIEARVPFLAAPVADAVLHLSERQLMPGGVRKGLLRAVARRHLPAEIVDRPKQGFAIPVGEWFRSDFGGMRQLLLDHLTGPEPFGPDHLGINAMINMEFVRRMLREHDEAGARSLWPWKGRDHSQRLYLLLVLSIWAKRVGAL